MRRRGEQDERRIFSFLRIWSVLREILIVRCWEILRPFSRQAWEEQGVSYTISLLLSSRFISDLKIRSLPSWPMQ